VKIIPYLHFAGNCEEALNFYKKVFNAEIGAINRYDNPALNVPEEYKDKILHTELTFGDNIIMVDDLMPGTVVDYGNGYALNIMFNSVEEATSAFNQLAEKGRIVVLLEKQFWGSWFGEVMDRFRVTWMIMC
jgi:PhnB protein